ncbi:MAG: tetratricopeptide repeat protein, partial [Rhodothermales bacterium]|nr:tetratricopeptide repeat protein [Rhodothermales bacterium]
IAMACYEGETLERRLQRGPLAVEEAVGLGVQVARGLGAAHRRGIVHRDLKPSNVFVTEDGTAKLLDFGIARVGGAAATQTGSTAGTAAYMAPEQLRGEVGERSDLWGLGVVLYEMVAGERPFRGDYEAAVLYAVLHEGPAPLPAAVPAGLAAVVGRCLEKDPAARYATAAEVEADLERVREGRAPAVSRPSPARRREGERGPWWSRLRHRGRWAAAAGAVLALAFVLVWGPARERATALSGAAYGWVFGAVPAEKHIAVLPFTTPTDDADSRAFANGLAELLTATITQYEREGDPLWVVPVREALAEDVTSAAEARRVFGVNLVLTGSVHRGVTGIRATLNLVDAETLRQLRSDVVDVAAEDLALLQDRAAQKLLTMLELALGDATAEPVRLASTEDPRALDFYYQGLGYLQQYQSVENIDRAIELFQRSAALDPAFAPAEAGLGEAYWRMYEATQDVRAAERAETHTRRALSLDAGLASAHVTLAFVYTGTGRAAEAEAEAEQALAIDPGHATAFSALASAYEGQGQLDEAEAAYRRAIQLRPAYWAPYNELGAFYSTYGRYEEAAEQFRKVVELVPENAIGYSHLGAVLFYLGREDEAAAQFERSIEIEPTYGAITNLATLHYFRGEYARAADVYRQALENNAADYRVWSFMASALDKAPGREEEARRTAERALALAEEQLALDSTDAVILADIAGYYVITGDPDAARDYLRRAERNASAEVDLLFQISSVYERLGDREAALDRLADAVAAGGSLSSVDSDPDFHHLVEDPRYQELSGDS